MSDPLSALNRVLAAVPSTTRPISVHATFADGRPLSVRVPLDGTRPVVHIRPITAGARTRHVQSDPAPEPC